MSKINDDLVVAGHLSANSMTVPDGAVSENALNPLFALPRANLAQDVLKPFTIPLITARVFDALATNLPATPASDDLGLVGGTHGSASPVISSGDLKAAGSTTRKARILYPIPAEYDAGETAVLRFSAGMLTNVADVAATLNIDVRKSDRVGGVGSNLYGGAAVSINSLTFANKDFNLTSSGLAPGDLLDILISVLVNDAATATAVTAQLGDLQLLADVRG